MKKYIFILLFSFYACNSMSQTKGSATIYAYEQSVLPGAQRGIIEEGGSEVVTDSRTGKNYFIYIASSSRIYPAEMWINGIPYSISMEIISRTPVINTNQLGDTVELVPSTNLKVLKLTPVPYTESKNYGNISEQTKNNALVIVYKQNGRFYFNSKKQFENLEAAAMQ